MKPGEGLFPFDDPDTIDTELLEVGAGLTENGGQVAKEDLALLFERRDVALVPRHFRATLQARQVWAKLDNLLGIRSLALRAEVEPFDLAGQGQEARQRVDAKVVQDERCKARSLAQSCGNSRRHGMLGEPRDVLEMRHFLQGARDKLDADELKGSVRRRETHGDACTGDLDPVRSKRRYEEVSVDVASPV